MTSINIPPDVYAVLKMRKQRTGVPIRAQLAQLVEHSDFEVRLSANKAEEKKVSV